MGTLRRAAAAVVCAAAVSACAVSHPTRADRAASMRPYEAVELDGVPIRRYALERSALLLAGGNLIGMNSNTREVSTFDLRSQGELSFGTATPVDSRGYYLTAAHCVPGEVVMLGVPTLEGIEILPARVVFQGDPDEEVTDLSVLHVERYTEPVFEWSRFLRPGEAVVSAGVCELPTDPPSTVALNCEPIGGKVLRAQVDETVTGVVWTVHHDSPVVLGNSGGPLMSTDGKLLAVNVAGLLSFSFRELGWQRSSIAVRPNLSWLKEVIETDAARRGG